MQIASDIAPWSALVGGAIIGLVASGFLVLSGRQTGISGIITGVWRASREARPIHLAFIFGLLGGGLIWAIGNPSVYGEIPRATPMVRRRRSPSAEVRSAVRVWRISAKATSTLSG